MLKNYIKIFFRNIWKHAGYSISNISGLAVGMVSCVLVLLFVQYEFNWNTSNENYERICRIQQKVIFKHNVEIYGQTGFPLAQEIKRQIPEIEQATVTKEIWNEYLSSSEDKQYLEEKGYYAYNELFLIFTFNFLRGNPESALSDPHSIILTQELADKYFPGEDAFGKTLKASQNKFLKVTGVIANLPLNLDFRPDYLVSFSTYKEISDWKDFDDIKNIDNPAFQTFVLMKSNTSVQEVDGKLYNFLDKYVTENFKKLYLKPLPDLHLNAGERGDIKVALYYIAGIAVFVLVLACINFINLATANSSLRKKEIGIRKVVGASKFSLFRQFIGESLFFTFISMILAFMLVELLLTPFNTIVQRQMDLDYVKDINFILTMVGAFTLTGILSGIYPALYLSSFKPVEIIKGIVSVSKKKRDHSRSYFRRSLVTFQFVISVSLIISTIFVMKQVDYMNNKDLGFNKENLLLCRVFGEDADGNFETLRNELLLNANIINASVTNNAPFNGNWGKEINREGALATDKMSVSFNYADYNFIDTYNMQMLTGRNFSKEFSTDSNACIINETAMRQLGWNDPIGKRIDDNKYTIIGVVKDFHQYSVHVPIPGYYMVLHSGSLKEDGIYSIRIKPGNRAETISFIREQFRKFFPDAIIEVADYSEDLQIGTEDVWEIVRKVFFTFAIIVVLIAANGLFGLVSFSAQRRIKEIGIRKVLGANAAGLYAMMSKEFIIILVIAVVLALPAGYFVSVSTPGAYKYQMGVWDYLVAVAIMFFTALIATVYQTTRAVLSNPVDSLKYE